MTKVWRSSQSTHGLARTGHNRSERSKARKDSGKRKHSGTDGETELRESESAKSSQAESAASIDVALDDFIARAHREFAQVPAAASSGAGKGAYHPAPPNRPLSWLAIGVAVGLTVGVLLTLALSR